MCSGALSSLRGTENGVACCPNDASRCTTVEIIISQIAQTETGLGQRPDTAVSLREWTFFQNWSTRWPLGLGFVNAIHKLGVVDLRTCA